MKTLKELEKDYLEKKEVYENADIVVGKSPGTEGQLSQRRSRWLN